MEHVELRLLLPEELTQDLSKDPQIGPSSRVVEDANHAALRLGLQDTAAVFTIVVAAVQLADYCIRLAQAIQEWMRRRRRSQLTVIVQAPHDDVVIRVDEREDPGALARHIELILRRA